MPGKSSSLNRKREILQDITFGKPTAEEEADALSGYFVETEQWRQIFAGEIEENNSSISSM